MNAPAGRPNPHAPAVAPVASGVPRPFWSVMIPAYECSAYLRRTLASVLAQAPDAGDMQIQVIDDHSVRDDPEAVVREMGGGRVEFYRHECNLGPVATFNTCITRARGQWLHILHGDDLVCPGFYATLHVAIVEHPELGAACCRCSVIDEQGREIDLYELEREDAGELHGFLARLAVWSRIQTPTIVVRRAVYEHLGGFDPRLIHTADWEMCQRLVAHYPIWYEPTALAQYRMHPGSDTSRLVRSGANVPDIRRAIEIANRYLPPHQAPDLRRQALAFHGQKAMWAAWEMRAKGDAGGAVAQFRGAVACFWDAGFRRRALRLWVEAMKLRLGRLVNVQRASAAGNV